MIIGISGKIGSGKDTIGKIIQYLVYCNHIEQDLVYEDRFPLPHIPNQFEIKKFAGKLKQIVSLLTGYTIDELEREDIKNRLLPEEWIRYYYASYKMKSSNNFTGRITKYFASRKEAEDYEFPELVNQVFDKSKLELVTEGITIRKLLQELGTEALREVIHPNVHINALFVDYKLCVQNCDEEKYIDDPNGCESKNSCKLLPNWLITDVRFPNEGEAIKKRNGILIRVERYMLTKIDQHPSETALDNYDGFNYIIQNDGTIQDLIIKVKEILIKEKIIS